MMICSSAGGLTSEASGRRRHRVVRRLAQRQGRGQIAHHAPPPVRDVGHGDAEEPLEQEQRGGVVEDVGRYESAGRVGRHEEAGHPESQADRSGDAAGIRAGSGFMERYSPAVFFGGVGGGTWSKKPPFSS